MQVGLLGFNHEYASLDLRERVSNICQRYFLRTSVYQDHFSFVLLATCNRIEIYFSSSKLASAQDTLNEILIRELDMNLDLTLYSKHGEECFKHLSRVTAGLDSAIVAETEIQGQVKRAYLDACSNGGVCKELHFIFQKSLRIGKKVRAELGFFPKMPTLEKILYTTSHDILKNLASSRVLFIGSSSINRQIIRYFKGKHINNITLISQSLERANVVSKEFGIIAKDWHSLSEWYEYDLIILGTKYHYFLIDDSFREMTVKKTKLVIDLSVPRNVDPIIERIPKLTLFNIDQLNEMIKKIRHITLQEVKHIEMLINENVKRQKLIFQEKEKVFQDKWMLKP